MIRREFDVIARHFRPLAGAGSLNLADDAAVITPPPGRELVISADAMVEGVHFLPDDPPETLGRKILRANLSDLAAMGAAPLGYLLTLAVPRDTPDSWFAALAKGLAMDQAAFNITLLGGDTSSTKGPICLSVTILGHVAPGRALRRAGARAGDGIFVTGTIGDGALGLLARQGRVVDTNGFLADRYTLPQPRLGLALAGIVSAAMDVSDGLIQDCEHLCRAGGVTAEIEAARVPLSAAARACDAEMLATCLTGGDDYELLLAVPPGNEAALAEESMRRGVPVTRIGRFIPGELPVRVLDGNGVLLGDFARPGWTHF